MNAYQKYVELRKKADSYLTKCFNEINQELAGKVAEKLKMKKTFYLQDNLSTEEKESFLEIYCDYHLFSKIEEFVVGVETEKL